MLAALAVQWACVDEARTETAAAHARDSSLTHDLLLAGYDSAVVFPRGRYFGTPEPVARTETESPGALADADSAATSPAPAAVKAAAPASSANAFVSPACASPAADDQQRCLDGYLKRSDVKLDSSYQKLISHLKTEGSTRRGSEPATVQRLRATQRNWLTYRADECRKRTASEGLLWAPARAKCMEAYSTLRQREFESALTERKITAQKSTPAKPKATKRTRRAKPKRHSGWGG